CWGAGVLGWWVWGLGRLGFYRLLRGLLLPAAVAALRGADGVWAVVPTVDYYLKLAAAVSGGSAGAVADKRMELSVSAGQRRAAERVLASAGVAEVGGGGRRLRPLVVLNPGAQNPAKRWAPERFARVADVLTRDADMQVLVSGSPGEAEVLSAVVRAAHAPVVNLAEHGLTLGALKGVVAAADLVVTNDTGT
ncbi:MAG: glycosyltransferase family 9 protein, partial [Planctomycetota bacterium]